MPFIGLTCVREIVSPHLHGIDFNGALLISGCTEVDGLDSSVHWDWNPTQVMLLYPSV